MFNPKKLAPDERLGRGVSSKSHRRQVRNGETPASLFYLREIDECKLSVDRIADEWLNEVNQMARERDGRRDRTFYGWATNSQELVSGLGLEAKASPKDDNKFHADICFPPGVYDDQCLMEDLAMGLSAKARWKSPAELQGCQ